jgi:Zn-dependent peptidase ImmA (M78 family)
MSSFERGFKSWCENIALELRKDLGLEPTAPLPSSNLARFLGVPLWKPTDLELSAESLETLLKEEQHGWSALTISVEGLASVIYNPSHSARRQSSDIMHELSHLVIGHEPSQVLFSQEFALVMRSFDRQQEEEASWLSGCLLLPRPALMAIATKRLPTQTACDRYAVSPDLLTYRLNISGVNAQIARRRPGSRARS